ncbi:MAG: polyhydroxyalkanoate synthesis repressor PhaR [Proteobacteria bacterium]|nr:polyhydroxyalkanoate synthesis repressor PhaR [Pseudomonadota bacterium]MCH9026735.1 polyhydroxyalkanoate synthesis repressor PhaR [Pseudomonadota bacterium]
MNDSSSRIIKKYPNRRLYDTEESRYITLADIRRLVLEKTEFVVIDKKSQEDITRSILLQVIADQEGHGEPVMSQDFLAQVIRSYGGTMQSMMSSYLEQSLRLFMTQQQQIRDKVKDVVGVDPVGVMTDIAQKNYERWKSVQNEIFRTLTDIGGQGNDRDKRHHDKDDDNSNDRPAA